MKFAESSRKTSFDEPRNYFPYPGYYASPDSRFTVQSLKTSFSQAPRFNYEQSQLQRPLAQTQSTTSLNNESITLMRQLMPDLYPKRKPNVFKSTLKEVKNSVELHEDYGQGLSKLLEQYNQTKHKTTILPGPADYNPSLSQITKKSPVVQFCPKINQHKGNQDTEGRNNNSQIQDSNTQENQDVRNDKSCGSILPSIQGEKSPHLQILIGNGDAKMALMTDEEIEIFEKARLFAARAPKNGMLKKAKIAKNVFDLAKEDAFDPSPEASSIELFLLRQKQLGPSEIPPPGMYFNAEKDTAFGNKQITSKSVHFGSTAKRTLTLTTDESSVERSSNDIHASLLLERKTRYFETLPRMAINSLPKETYQTEMYVDDEFSDQQISEILKKTNKKQLSRTKLKNRYPQPTSSFGTSKKLSTFERTSDVDNSPGPGAYSTNVSSMKSLSDFQGRQQMVGNNRVYYSSVFGSGTKRFPQITS